MEQNNFDSNYKQCLDNNNKLLEVVNDLLQLKNNSKDEPITEGLATVIDKINSIIETNNKGLELIQNDYSSLTQQFDELQINNRNDQELVYEEGRYVGQVLNGLADGKGVVFFTNGDKYEGECKEGKAEGRGVKEWANGDRYQGDYRNDKKETKGIYYYSNGDKYEGDWVNGKREGKGIYYYNNGDRYEGDWKDDKKEGSGIYYYSNGDRKMGDYSDDKPIGPHVFRIQSGEVFVANFQ